jgi:hypothetical protein
MAIQWITNFIAGPLQAHHLSCRPFTQQVQALLTVWPLIVFLEMVMARHIPHNDVHLYELWASELRREYNFKDRHYEALCQSIPRFHEQFKAMIDRRLGPRDSFATRALRMQHQVLEHYQYDMHMRVLLQIRLAAGGLLDSARDLLMWASTSTTHRECARPYINLCKIKSPMFPFDTWKGLTPFINVPSFEGFEHLIQRCKFHW